MLYACTSPFPSLSLSLLWMSICLFVVCWDFVNIFATELSVRYTRIESLAKLPKSYSFAFVYVCLFISNESMILTTEYCHWFGDASVCYVAKCIEWLQKVGEIVFIAKRFYLVDFFSLFLLLWVAFFPPFDSVVCWQAFSLDRAFHFLSSISCEFIIFFFCFCFCLSNINWVKSLDIADVYTFLMIGTENSTSSILYW